MVILSITVNVQPSKRSELLLALRLLADKACTQKGCAGCRISQDIDNENCIDLEETWEKRHDLETYFRSETFSALLGAVKLLGEFYDISINDGSHVEGKDAIDAIRFTGK